MFNNLRKTIAFFLVASIGGISGAYFSKNYFTSSDTAKSAFNMPVRAISFDGKSGGPVDFTEAAENSIHGVVHVKTFYAQPTNYRQNNMWDPFGFFDNRNFNQGPRPASTGSGVIISEDGYIVTNNHVVENADKVEITLNDNSKYTGKVVGTDPSTDLALVKIEGKSFSFLSFGNSDEVKVGQWVLAVGNPFDLNSTVTAGIVSAKGRNINIIPNSTQPIESFIQTDAAINPGNSGGALVNTNGELIGINSAIASNTGSYSGYGFAVPVNIVKKVVNDFIEFGSVQRGYIGISGREMDGDFAKEKGISETRGVYIDKVTDDGGAKAAGLKEGDVITKIDNQIINSFPELIEQVGRHRPGDKLNITYSRGENQKETIVTLKNKMGNEDVVKNDIVISLGAELSSLSEDEKGKLGIDGGVKVNNIGIGKLKSAGIREGFIITSIDNKRVSTPSELESVLNNKKGGVLIEGVYPNGMRAWYGFGN